MQLDYISANAPFALNTPLGPFITAIVYATSLVGLVLQRLIQIVLNVSRLSTSTGDDVDSFVEDFGLSRLPGVKATGVATLSRIVTAVSQIPILVGTRLQTQDNPPVIFQVLADTNNASFDLGRNAYLLQSGAQSVDVTVEALEIGIGGNVLPGTLTKIATSLPGIDNVINGSNFINGADQEGDDDLKVRFALYIQSLSKSTMTAILSAIANVQAGLIYTVTENTNIDGTANNGQFIALIDDGTGFPNNSLLDDIARSIENNRPIGVRPIVLGPTLVRQVQVYAVIAYDPNLVPDALAFRSAIKSYLVDYINGTSFRDTPRLSVLYRTIWNTVSPGDAIETTIAPTGVSSSNQLYVSSTEGMALGQLVNVDGATTASGSLPRIISIETDSFIIVFPPLIGAPLIDSIVTCFSLDPGQIVNINAPIETGLWFASITTVQAGGGFAGSAFNGSYPGITGISTRIYLTSTAGILVNDLVAFDGWQVDPNTSVPSATNMKSKVVAVDVPTNSLVLQPPLGQLATDGSWLMIQPTINALPLMPIGTIGNRAIYGAETLIGPGNANLGQVSRTSVDKIYIVLTTVAA